MRYGLMSASPMRAGYISFDEFPPERRPHNSEKADLQIYLKQANLSTKGGPSWML